MAASTPALFVERSFLSHPRRHARQCQRVHVGAATYPETVAKLGVHFAVSSLANEGPPPYSLLLLLNKED
jgi:hypothetical protein